MMALVVIPYLAVAIFATAVVVRWVKVKRMPVHLRWELYPVAHEAGAAHGGSFFEHLDWWNRRPEKTWAGELRVMVPEILLLNGVRAHNRTLWFRSYPFHLGLYLAAIFVGLLALDAVRGATGLASADGWLAASTTMVGVAGLVLLGVGSLGLLARRLGDPVLRQHSSAADFANLIWFGGIAILGLVGCATVDPGFAHLRRFMQAAITLEPAGDVPLLVAAEVIAGSALVAYIPLTHMSHFFTKWFMYHDVRWNDEVNRKGSRLETALGRQLGHKVRWNAPHIRGEGKKTWAEVATEEVGEP